MYGILLKTTPKERVGNLGNLKLKTSYNCFLYFNQLIPTKDIYMAISKNRGTNSVAVCILNICASLITKHNQTNTSRRSSSKSRGKTNMNNDIWLNICVIYLGDIQSDCATHNEYISEVHDTIRIKIGTYL